MSLQPRISLLALALQAALAFGMLAPVAASAQTTIGAAAPMTGARALLGRNLKQGVDLAVSEINATGGVLGKPLQVVFEDDQGDNPNAAINAVNRLIQVHKVPVMLGPHYTVAQLATQKIFCDAPIVSFTGASGIPVTTGGCKHVVRVRANDTTQAKALIEFVRSQLKVDKIGIIYVNDDFGKAGAQRVASVIEGYGLKPVAMEGHNPQDKDFSAQLGRLRNAGAAAVVLWTHDTEAALIVRQAKQLGLAMRFAGSTSLSEPSFVKLAGEAAEGVLSANDFVPGNPDPTVQAFVKKYEARYKSLPEIWASAYYDATYLAAKAIEAAGSTDADKIRAAMPNVKYSGLLGTYRCEPEGDCNHQIHIVEIVKGEPVVKNTVKF
jgi:branched-chain amino acid transport system substrate-binding protein